MTKSGQIIIVEDDHDDQELLADLFKKLNYKNEILFFDNGEEAYNHITKPDVFPFIILSDINMPKLSGMQLNDKIQANEELRMKSIPFIFFTTTASKNAVAEAYYKSVQGFFQKPNTLEDLERIVTLIINYWKECMSPNKYE